MKYTFTEQLKIALNRKGITAAGLADMLGVSAQNLHQQLKRDNFREKDIKKICDLIGYDYILEIKEKPQNIDN